MIKDLVVNLAQITIKSVVMDIVVVDILARFDMLLSRSWGSNIGASIKLDSTYATVPMFGGEERRLYRKSIFVKAVTRADCSKNAPMYGKEKDFSCLLLEENDKVMDETQVEGSVQLNKQSLECNKVLRLYFGGAYSRKGNVVGVLLVSPKGSLIPLSFKLEFEATNNVVEYEALLLGLQAAINLNIGCLTVFGDSELVVKQIRNQCQTKHPRLKASRNEVWDLIENFFLAFNIQFLRRDRNQMAVSLVVVASNFKPPQNPLRRYEVEVRYKPSLLDNVKYWQVFEDEEQIKCFMEVIGEFLDLVIDQDDEEMTCEQQAGWEETIIGHKILQLKGNIIPKGLVPLERLFNSNDVATKPTKQELEEDVEDYNIGTEGDPRIIKLAKGVPREYKKRYLNLFKEYMDVFS